MATSSKRVLWKGAISFGLVHIPIALHSATDEQGIDFDWLDKRTMDRVGYKRINKKTGEEIAAENIVKGIATEDGKYVVLTPEEITAAYPKTTQTIEIETFVPTSAVPFVYFERPYYISPTNKADKVYALLREVLKKTDKVGIAKVVIQTKQHLALLAPAGAALVLNLLRWGDEVRPLDDLALPAAGTTAAGLSAKELQMGEQLVGDMSSDWKPEEFTNQFKAQIMKLVETKVDAGDTETSGALEATDAADSGATVYDLTELLRRSLGQRAGSKAPDGAAAAKPPAQKKTGSTPKATAAKKTAAGPAKAAKKPAQKRKAA